MRQEASEVSAPHVTSPAVDAPALVTPPQAPSVTAPPPPVLASTSAAANASKSSSWGKVLLVIVLVVVGVFILVKVSSKSNESSTSTDYNEPISSTAARSRCQKYIPQVCRAMVGCVPGFFTTASAKAERSAEQQEEFKRLVDATFAACKKHMETQECLDRNYGWRTASDFDLDFCYRSPQCDCNLFWPCEGKLTFSESCPNLFVRPSEFVSLDEVTLETALAFSARYGDGDTDRDSAKALTFLGWARKRLTWELASSVKTKTKSGLVFKDPSTEYGKGFCASGSIIQISKRFGSEYEVLLSLDDFSTVRLLAVQSTGELVERSRAKFCGVVMGTYSYTTRGGGTNTVVDIVGMFDLPENHKTPK